MISMSVESSIPILAITLRHQTSRNHEATIVEAVVGGEVGGGDVTVWKKYNNPLILLNHSVVSSWKNPKEKPRSFFYRSEMRENTPTTSLLTGLLCKWFCKWRPGVHQNQWKKTAMISTTCLADAHCVASISEERIRAHTNCLQATKVKKVHHFYMDYLLTTNELLPGYMDKFINIIT